MRARYRKISMGLNPSGDPALDVTISWSVGVFFYVWDELIFSDKELRVYDIHGISIKIETYNPETLSVSGWLDYYMTASARCLLISTFLI